MDNRGDDERMLPGVETKWSEESVGVSVGAVIQLRLWVLQKNGGYGWG